MYGIFVWTTSGWIARLTELNPEPSTPRYFGSLATFWNSTTPVDGFEPSSNASTTSLRPLMPPWALM